MKPKIIALYLPQFHQIPENDKFWGEGFTDWVTVRNAKPLFEGHQQPRVPLNDNYYDLSIKENVEWQSKLAHEHGIYGFGVYHYWFNNEKNLLTKPAEIMRDNDNIQTKYFFIWDNGNWKRSWSNVSGNDWAPIADNDETKKGPQILIPYILGHESDWKNHFQYILTHFKSKKYILIDNKPVFCIINYSKEIWKMCNQWNLWAQEEGYEGVYFIFQNTRADILPRKIPRYRYEPHSSGWWTHLDYWDRLLLKLGLLHHQGNDYTIYDYEEIWKILLENAQKHPEAYYYHGAFISYDDSPRRGRNHSKIVKGESLTKFEKYFSELVKISVRQDKDFIFLTAWNEWGEGAFLEPDEINKYDYLNAIKRCIKE